MSRQRIALGAGLVVLGALIEPSGTTRSVLALAAAGIAIWPASSTNGSGSRRTRALVLVALFTLSVSVSESLPGFLSSWKVRVWNVYHYYLGAKYFAELGYHDLYEATLQADREGQRYWGDIRRIRDLETYEVEALDPRERTYDPRAAFTVERWAAFRRDVEALSGQRSPNGWRGIFVDRGYNATPFWTVVGATLARLAPADKPLALKLLCSLDLLLLAATFWLLGRTFGAQIAALVALLLALSPVNENRLVGGFLQYDWFCAVAVSFCCYRRGRQVAAAGAMSYAVLTRIFPVLFVVAGMLPMARTWWRTRRLPKRPSRYLLAFGAWCALGLLLSLGNGRGIDGWREFATGISRHAEHHVFGERRIGLGHLLTHPLGSFEPAANRQERRENRERQQGAFTVAAFGLGCAFVFVAWRQRSWNARLLGLVPIYALFVTSRYYWSYLALMPLAGGRRGPPAARSRWLAGMQLVSFAAFYALLPRLGDPYAAYVLLGALVLVYLVFALAVLSRRQSP